MNPLIPLISSYSFPVQIVVILRKSLSTAIEIKPKKKLIEDWDKLKPKFKAAHAFAKEKGWKFNIINESRL